MSVALPNGYVSVPGSQNLGYTLGCSVSMFCTTGEFFTVNGWRFYGVSHSGSGPFAPGRAELWLAGPFGPDIMLEGHDVSFPSGEIPRSSIYAWSEAATGIRLGRVLQNFTEAIPAFGQRDWQEIHAFFYDAGTTITQTAGGQTFVQTFSDPPTFAAPVQGLMNMVPGNTSANPPSGTPSVQVSSVSCDGFDSSLFSQLDNGVVRGSGSGFELYQPVSSPAVFVAPPFNFSYDAEVTQDGTVANNWAHIIDKFLCRSGQYSALPFMTAPANNGAYNAQNVNWPITRRTFGLVSPGSVGHSPVLSLVLDPAWYSILDPPLQVADRYIGIRGMNGLDAPDVPSSYNPVKFKVLPSLNVHRPDGNKPSSWVSLDITNGTVSDGATDVQFTVINSGAKFKRTLASLWRTDGRPARDVRHHTSEDIIWYAIYAYLKEVWNAIPTACTITLTLNGVHLEMPGSVEHAFSFDHPVSFAGGAQTIFRDLIVGSGVETYPTRVDSLTLTFSAAHASPFTLHDALLVARTDLVDPGGKAYIKTRPTYPNGSDDHNMVVVSMDGAATLGCPPPVNQKASELLPEAYGGSPKHVEDGGDMYSLSDYWTEAGPEFGLGAMDGIEAPIYTLASYEAANKDTYGNTLGPERADWIEIPPSPGISELVLAGTYWQPNVSPLVAQVLITNLVPYTIKSRWSLWGGFEAVVMQSGARAPDGVRIRGRRTDTGMIAGTGFTKNGFVEVSPVPANGGVSWEPVKA